VQLTSLEIKGFKSFADKTVVSFDAGITGIIGPNGCGKSNIIDSIRWVIGEQKISSLRSENLEALIFNGSKTRNPSGLAEVSLTFENTKNLLPTEFSTITVSRRFFKNGESEYRLNDVQCRLKDIQNLFLDTGISTDSYAIIELGMVDEIIKDKDNSRRRMLEQAAGITIYKTRKKEAKNKLDATEQDLARIEDLVFEINNQLKALENQAKKAEKYFEIKKEYKNTSIELAKCSLAGYNDQYISLQQQNDAAVDKKTALEAAIAQEEAALEQEKLGLVEKEQLLQQQQAQFNTLINELRTAESNKSLLQQKMDFIAEKKESVEQFLVKAQAQLKGLEESVVFSEKQINDEQTRLTELEENHNNINAIVEEKRKAYDEQRALVDEQRQQIQQLQYQQYEAEKKVAVADTAIANVMATIKRLEDDNANRQTQQKNWQDELKAKQELLQKSKQDLQTLNETYERIKQEIFKTQESLEGLRNTLSEENRLLDSKKNEFDLLKNLIDSMEGYPDSVKFLHAEAKQWNAKASILSDIVYVKEEYRLALENILEPYLNYYIANNTQEALTAVNLLHGNKKGKANFFILDKIAGHSETVNVPNNTIAALSVVEYDSQYTSLVNYLLKDVFIAEADELMEANEGKVILSKSGKWVKGKYTVSGGSIGAFEGNKIGRAKNLEKLTTVIAAQQKLVDDLKQQIEAQHNQVLDYNSQLKDAEIKQLQQTITSVEQQIFALENKTEQNGQLLEENQKRLTEYTSQITTTNTGIADVRNSLVAVLENKQAVTATLEKVTIAFTEAEQSYNQAVSDQNQYQVNLARQQSKLQNLQQEFQFKQNQIVELQLQIDDSTTQLKLNTENSDENAGNLEQLVAGIAVLLKQKESEEKELSVADQAYYNLRNALQQKDGDIKTKVKQKETFEQELNAVKDKVNEMKLHLAGLKERLMVEFRIDLDEIINEERKTEETQEELQATTDKLKKRLENIGEINPTAVETFEEMKKRYDFIVTQKMDLVSAKDSLLQTIAEVEATANQKFLDTFNKVKENFQKVFKALFTEDDTADLILENPENLAETGIDIIAKPKGKRPSSIGQLSGGERTLTATALLFSIYLIKPAPFCILDEVDAPLDDANVGKFTQMIRKFSENSQFIIVTHNKQTMAAVDVIYGVTMQEPGVSKLVPVDFRNLN
jgi:chromosome segregation protein